MKVEINISEDCSEPKIIIFVNELTPEIENILELLKNLSEVNSRNLNGFKNEEIFLIERDEVLTIYAENQRVYARCVSGTYLLKHRIYELESMLLGTNFLRISNSEIVNFNKVKSLDMSIKGTISLRLKTGDTSFVSRRYVDRINKYLGLKGDKNDR